MLIYGVEYSEQYLQTVEITPTAVMKCMRTGGYTAQYHKRNLQITK